MSHPVSALPRSTGSIVGRRARQPWPEDREFRILSIDGGGIRGLFPSGFLAALESASACGRPIVDHFDLLAGTSTGGIVALGLAAGKSAAEIRDLYRTYGPEIFPPFGDGMVASARRAFMKYAWGLVRYRYSRDALENVVQRFVGGKTLGDACTRLVIPTIDGRHSEVGVFKNRFHPHYKMDHLKSMTEAALATSAAPTIFSAYDKDGMRYLDGGVWANNPILIAVHEVLIAYDVPLDRIRVLSIGCGDEPYRVTDAMAGKHWIGGGIWGWKGVFGAAMRYQSQSAVNQARLLLGTDRVIRVEPSIQGPAIELDDYVRAVAELLPAVGPAVATFGDRIMRDFLDLPAEPFVPAPWPEAQLVA